MGMSYEINGNNCFLSNTSLQMSSLVSNCGETLVLSPNGVQNMPQMMTGLEMNAFNTTFNGLDLNNSLIINTNDLTSEQTGQQILLVSSPMDLMAVQQSQQSLIAKPQQTAVQMVLQTTDFPLISSGTQLNVIQVPTNLLLTDNNLIVIPQEGITLEVPALDTNVSQQTLVENQLTYDNKSQTLVYNGSPQLIEQQINCYSNQNLDQLVVNLNDCIAINAINNKSVDSPDGNQYFQSNHQIIGIIDGNPNETKVIAANELSAGFDDLNTFLATSLSPNQTQECDANEAKSWLNDSLIAYRAMAAFKKVMPNDTPSPTSGIQIPVQKPLNN